MGTRALTILNEDDKQYAAIYRQMDGYITGHGQALKDMLHGHRLCNGFQLDMGEEWHNGISCLAAYVVHKLKEEHLLGGIYLQPTTTPYPEAEHPRERYGYAEDDPYYVYVLQPFPAGGGDSIHLTVLVDDVTYYDGDLDLFDPEQVEKQHSNDPEGEEK